MAKPNSVEIGRSRGNGLVVTTLPTGGIRVAGWALATADGTRYPCVVEGTNWYVEVILVRAATSIRVEITLYEPPYFGSWNTIYDVTDTVSSEVADDWVFLGFHIVPTSGATPFRIYRQNGSAGTLAKVFDDALTNSEMKTTGGAAPGNPSQFSVGYPYTDAPADNTGNVYAIDWRCYADANEATVAAIAAKWADLDADTSAYWHWKLQWVSGAADLTDSSGNNRPPTNFNTGNGNTLYEGPAGPIDPGSESVDVTIDGYVAAPDAAATAGQTASVSLAGPIAGPDVSASAGQALASTLAGSVAAPDVASTAGQTLAATLAGPVADPGLSATGVQTLAAELVGAIAGPALSAVAYQGGAATLAGAVAAPAGEIVAGQTLDAVLVGPVAPPTAVVTAGQTLDATLAGPVAAPGSTATAGQTLAATLAGLVAGPDSTATAGQVLDAELVGVVAGPGVTMVAGQGTAGVLAGSIAGTAAALTAGQALAATLTGPVSAPSLVATAGMEGVPAYPLRVASSGRHLEDQNGVPFQVRGDAAWSLMIQLSQAEVVTYLDSRKSLGFNVALVNLIDRVFGDKAPANYYDELPFQGDAFQSDPNDDYFDHVDYVVGQAAARGIVLLLDPTYLGYTWAEGWSNEIAAASTAQMQAWGAFLGNRYKAFGNIIWVVGGDTDPTSYAAKLEAFVTGLRGAGANQLITAHNAPESTARDPWTSAEWLAVNNVYSYSTTTWVQMAAAYAVTPTMPAFFVEGGYEGEASWTAQQLRAFALWGLLGGCGHVFGNRPIWLFDTGWQSALSGTGSTSMGHIHDVFAARAWHLLEPDADVLTAGESSGAAYALAARASDGSTAIAYLPTSREVTADLTKIAGASAIVAWINPATGAVTSEGSFATSGPQSFTPPAAGDWILVLDSAGFVDVEIDGALSPPAAQIQAGQTLASELAGAVAAPAAEATAGQVVDATLAGPLAAPAVAVTAGQVVDATLVGGVSAPDASATAGQVANAELVGAVAPVDLSGSAGQVATVELVGSVASVGASATAGQVVEAILAGSVAAPEAEVTASQGTSLSGRVAGISATMAAGQTLDATLAGTVTGPSAQMTAGQGGELAGSVAPVQLAATAGQTAVATLLGRISPVQLSATMAPVPTMIGRVSPPDLAAAAAQRSIVTCAGIIAGPALVATAASDQRFDVVINVDPIECYPEQIGPVYATAEGPIVVTTEPTA